MTRDWEVMAVDITTSPTFKAGAPASCSSCPVPSPGTRCSGRTSALTASASFSPCLRLRPGPAAPLKLAERGPSQAVRPPSRALPELFQIRASPRLVH